jgi:hypothetical protein
MKHLEQTLASYVYSHCIICNIPIYFCNIHMKHLQHTFEISETLQTYACNTRGHQRPSVHLGAGTGPCLPFLSTSEVDRGAGTGLPRRGASLLCLPFCDGRGGWGRGTRWGRDAGWWCEPQSSQAWGAGRRRHVGEGRGGQVRRLRRMALHNCAGEDEWLCLFFVEIRRWSAGAL